MLTKEQIDQFNRDGFLLIKNVFSPNEIEEIRKKVETVVAREPINESAKYRVTVGDLSSKPELAHLTFDRRLTQIAHDILGPRVIYFGESNVMIGALSRGFHRDNADRNSPEGPDWRMPDKILKMGIYCQDHSQHSGGLKVRYGSHLAEDFIPGKYSDKIGRGKIYNITNKNGDLIIWSMRIAHSANFVRAKVFPKLTFDPWWEWKIPAWLQRPQERERIAIFNAFGAPSENLDHYIDYCVKRGDSHNHWKKSRYDSELQKEANTVGVEIRQPIPEYGSLYQK